eukprot:TRINITY_DN12644_c0_g1::TRINITY_DN12644_c0_g1_i2::g.13530::m.13530 TRINITY_DN12644_c0_g1::TRINITY_DN12644_c0_g1_i2::g.13530  ORF type:complete len:163 (+),score=30.75,DNA_repr_REX1B/PF14966.1/7e-14 TRINITY_DN12644_c0_g1_i2:222-710(+)
MDLEKLIPAILSLQSKRAVAYKQFNSAFDGLIKGNIHAEFFQNICSDIMKQFIELSNEVNLLSGEATQLPTATPLLLQLQALEQKKLHLTISLQRLRLARQSDADPELMNAVFGPNSEVRVELGEIMGTTNADEFVFEEKRKELSKVIYASISYADLTSLPL